MRCVKSLESALAKVATMVTVFIAKPVTLEPILERLEARQPTAASVAVLERGQV